MPSNSAGTAFRARALRLYRRSLILYPAEFRDIYARELCLVFDDRCRAQRSSLAMSAVWIHATLGVLTEAPKEHYYMIIQDLRYALRIMRKDAGVSATAIVVLALGIGSTTLVFSLANGLLVRPLPYPEQSRLVAVQEFNPHGPISDAVAFPNYLDMRARMQLLEDIGLYVEGEETIRGEGEAERVPAAGISDGVMGILRVRPLLGRAFTRQDDMPGNPSTVILGEELWRRRYGADSNIIGKTLGIGNDRSTVIGVMPSGFNFPGRAELWRPLQLSPDKSTRTDHYLRGMARLKAGVSVEQATAELQSMMKQINAENPVTSYGNSARAIPLRNYVSERYRVAVITLLGAVGFLLLIACANVMNLLLVKASSRAREMALRTALGASRRRLVRQLISESLLLGLFGGAAGLVFAYAGLRPLLSLIPVQLPRWMDFSIDRRVLAFALGISILTSVVSGLAPAFGASGVDLTDALKEGGRSGTAGRGRRFLRSTLVVAEVALSLALLTGAGLMVRSFIALHSQPLGFESDKILTLEIGTPSATYPAGPSARALMTRVRDEVASLPGIRSAAFASGVPLNSGWGRSLTAEGHPVLALKDAPMINHNVITSGYFRTLGIALLEGRDFTDTDWDNPLVTIVDQSLAKHYWPGQSAIGKRVRFGPPEANEPWHTIVGVVADTRNESLYSLVRWNVYIPFSARFTADQSLIARTSQDPMSLLSAVRSRIQGIDRDLAVSQELTMKQIIDRDLWQERFFAVLFAIFAALALLLAGVGLYGVLGYAVSLRTHEIGIRMALGATAPQVRGMVMRQSTALVGAGVLLGLLATYGLTRLLASQLFNISPSDPATYLEVMTVLAAIAVLASYLPARRATRVEPVTALREE